MECCSTAGRTPVTSERLVGQSNCYISLRSVWAVRLALSIATEFRTRLLQNASLYGYSYAANCRPMFRRLLHIILPDNSQDSPLTQTVVQYITADSAPLAAFPICRVSAFTRLAQCTAVSVVLVLAVPCVLLANGSSTFERGRRTELATALGGN